MGRELPVATIHNSLHPFLRQQSMSLRHLNHHHPLMNILLGETATTSWNRHQLLLGVPRLWRGHPLFSHIYIIIIIIYSCPPKARSIFGLHRKRQCQKFRLCSDWVGCIGIYVPLHSLGPYNVFVAKSVFVGKGYSTSLRQNTLETRHG